MYEAIQTARQRRQRLELVHSALAIGMSSGRFMVEMTPVPDADGAARGVVAQGPVGMQALGRWRLFRYEIRRWRDGIVPDLGDAIASPIRLTDDPVMVQRVFDRLPHVPPLVWGRDEARIGEMWTCNSVISWTLASAGIDVAHVLRPRASRAPGWDAGREFALRPTACVSARAQRPWPAGATGERLQAWERQHRRSRCSTRTSAGDG